ncbi:RNA polymerase sigma factor [Salipiger abyssi]|uniref:RNA polymerase sigma factor n=1 Tax=Salipiger abyssi TaxID=1250539 RepID=A0A1P8UYI0_9RHOB|nr:sigma-70 family RNA polymerase sigma factor [Salipiger abyssi]APZ54441.1 RNA polymerase sigma-70 factor, ECF subfamily [Salipiger abyssi]
MDQRAEDARAAMAAMAQGDRQALGRLVALYGPGLTRYAAQMLDAPSEAEDVVQEVFLKAWRNAGRYDPAKAAVSTWLYRIAVNHCIDRSRRTRFRRFIGLEATDEMSDDGPGAAAIHESRDRLAHTRAAIAELPDRQRRAILLRAAGDMSTAEIAATMGVSPGAVEQLLVRARNTLRRQLDPDEMEERRP